MRRSAFVSVVLVAGLALVIGLFFVFRGGSDDETVASTETGAATPTGTETETETGAEPETTATGTTGTGETVGPESEFLIIVRDGKPAAGVQHLRAPKGGRIVLRVDSDVADEVHVHGYDLMQDVAPGAPARIRFTANIAGRFEIELEDRGTPIAELEVR